MGINAVQYDKLLVLNNPAILELTTDLEITKGDINILGKLSEQSLHHKSGGSYNMLAKWVKGSRSHLGLNRLTRRANTMDETYPEICGVHAELDLFYRTPSLKGGTVYIAGTRNKTKTQMPNTSPCIHCKALLAEAYVRYVVFYSDNEPIKLPLAKWHYYNKI